MFGKKGGKLYLRLTTDDYDLVDRETFYNN